MSQLEKPLVWVDLEMTDLDLSFGVIIEIAVAITDGSLEQVIKGPSIVINHPEESLQKMSDFVKNMHEKSGLTDSVRKSTIDTEAAEKQVIEFIQTYVNIAPTDSIWKKPPIAGNTVHIDKRFIDKYMPKLSSILHYRCVDVTTIKEMVYRWYPEQYEAKLKKKQKSGKHRALDDILESIEELKGYKSDYFVSQ